jgi:hypothetical protein
MSKTYIHGSSFSTPCAIRLEGSDPATRMSSPAPEMAGGCIRRFRARVRCHFVHEHKKEPIISLPPFDRDSLQNERDPLNGRYPATGAS